MDFPLIYVNGCSYSDENYRPIMQGRTYGHYYAEITNGYCLNKAKSGSCNRRIIRTTAYDMIEQRKLNPTQPILALIQLSFEIRDEIWIDDITYNENPQESNFRTHQFSHLTDWRDRLFKNDSIGPDKGFLQKWSEGRAFYYSSYAERINLLLDVLFLKNLLESMDIEYLFFQGPTAEKLESEYLKDFFLQQIQDPRIFDFETFGFCNWCHDQGFVAHDEEPIGTGHYRPDAHQAFAENFLSQIL
jgi:hypothetical protein